MTELVALLVIVVLSMLVVRVGAIALEKTGLSRDTAAFQAQSAFMGVGFTTVESEHVVNHAVRRRIISLLMLLGFVAVTSTLGTLVVTFAAEPGGMSRPRKLLFVLLGAVALYLLNRFRAVERLLDRAITRALERSGGLHVIDYRGLMNLDKGYTIATLLVDEGSWLEGRTLRELALAEEGLLVLNITRATGLVIATPASRTRLHRDDQLLLYGLEEDITRLIGRRADEPGARAHAEAVERQRLRIAEERVEDAISEREPPPVTAEDGPERDPEK